jgi:hypothetical protein
MMKDGLHTSGAGTKRWYLNGQYHRTDGPAIEFADGAKWWYLNGRRHRTDGPATEEADGSKEWWLNGRLHRADGPAVEWDNGSKYWYLNDQGYLLDQWLEANTELSDQQRVMLKLEYA